MRLRTASTNVGRRVAGSDPVSGTATKSALCVLCGVARATTSEHVPPESFFESPYPPNLITVPACLSCNRGSATDDDYLLAYLVSIDVPGGAPTLAAVRDRVTRALHRPEFPGLKRRLQRNLVASVTEVPDTVELDARLRLRLEGERALRTIQKQTRAIAYFVTGRMVPRSTVVQAERLFGETPTRDERYEMLEGAEQFALEGTTGTRGDVFRYAYRPVKQSACSAVVSLEFYDVFRFVALIFQPGFATLQNVFLPFGKT